MQVITEAWRFFEFKDIIDVFCVGLIFYQFIRILRGTRSMQMLLGIILLGVVSIVGRTYKFHSINWLLENFFDSFILILVILFQEEIRSALVAMANRQTFFKKLKDVDLEEVINEIVEASWDLKVKKTGAIIAIENKSGLNNILESGTILNSVVHRDLLLSIFNPKSPLHDGAVVIQKNKISAASCFLPIDSKANSSNHIGARHRAALGLSQLVDALIIVVSEETGDLSLCFEGKIRPIPDSFTLKRAIKYSWGTGEDLEQILPNLENY